MSAQYFLFEKIYKEEIVMKELEKIMEEIEKEACKIEKAQNRKKLLNQKKNQYWDNLRTI